MQKYNLSEIMSQAWFWFRNDDISLSAIEWIAYGVEEKTFSACLKASWEKAKEEAQEKAEELKAIATSEELKAFNWAEKKLGVSLDLSDERKFNAVINESKYAWNGTSVWSIAMKAVRICVSNQAA